MRCVRTRCDRACPERDVVLRERMGAHGLDGFVYALRAMRQEEIDERRRMCRRTVVTDILKLVHGALEAVLRVVKSTAVLRGPKDEDAAAVP